METDRIHPSLREYMEDDVSTLPIKNGNYTYINILPLDKYSPGKYLTYKEWKLFQNLRVARPK